ncbi:MAG: hypothetical protein L0Y54_04050 [Sporichthyaceae bacterium]|nr:hypothetical protein [Sporichthyaceae bacterium]
MIFEDLSSLTGGNAVSMLLNKAARLAGLLGVLVLLASGVTQVAAVAAPASAGTVNFQADPCPDGHAPGTPGHPATTAPTTSTSTSTTTTTEPSGGPANRSGADVGGSTASPDAANSTETAQSNENAAKPDAKAGSSAAPDAIVSHSPVRNIQLAGARPDCVKHPGQLPFTGASTGPLLGLGVALVVAGAVSLALARRRSARSL